MLRRLSAFQLGIFMPHQHDEATGEFLRLPADGPQRCGCKDSRRVNSPATDVAPLLGSMSGHLRA